MREYELHPEAYVDLHEIGQYVADDSPAAAKRVVNEIFDAIGANGQAAIHRQLNQPGEQRRPIMTM